MKFDIISKRYWFFLLSGLIIVPGLISMLTQGFNLGIDFTGGTLLDLKFARPVTVTEVRSALTQDKLEGSTIQLAMSAESEASQNVFIRTRELSDDERRAVLADMEKSLGAFETLRAEKVGATIGSELTMNAVKAVIISWILMIMYISYRFEFKFAVSGVLAIAHDIIVVLGIFSLLHKEIDGSFVAAILTIVGYSINDTIVIFDRIRENLKKQTKSESFAQLVNMSIWQTMTRSVYTVLTVVIATAALYLFGGETTKNFSLALLIGFCSGAYSSIFNASPIWVTWKEYEQRKQLALKTGGAK